LSQPQPIKSDFFVGDVKKVARELLGTVLCVRKKSGSIFRSVINETEAYDGEKDLACHASKGRTARTSTMYERGGVCYVYLCYGMHWMLNIVTGEEGYPAAVLIRGTEAFNGPGRLTKGLGVTGSFKVRIYILRIQFGSRNLKGNLSRFLPALELAWIMRVLSGVKSHIVFGFQIAEVLSNLK